MPISIVEIGADRLAEYARVPMLCDVRSILAIDEISAAMSLNERPVQIPYTKNYDAYSDGGPLNWAKRFDISDWGIWIAVDEGEVAGGAAVAWKTPGIDMLENRTDMAVRWDIRVRKSNWRTGVGRALLREAARWSKSRGCRMMKIETQNVNVTACRFYAAMGCSLDQIDPLAYGGQPEVAAEIMLIWRLDLLRNSQNL